LHTLIVIKAITKQRFNTVLSGHIIYANGGSLPDNPDGRRKPVPPLAGLGRWKKEL